MKVYEQCSNCGNNKFYIYRNSEDPIGTYEECVECGER